jgi:hypothetical protein
MSGIITLIELVSQIKILIKFIREDSKMASRGRKQKARLL